MDPAENKQPEPATGTVTPIAKPSGFSLDKFCRSARPTWRRRNPAGASAALSLSRRERLRPAPPGRGHTGRTSCASCTCRSWG